ncbi:MAG: hypothetical protein IKU52_02500 [Clostridia bacterium]|nr:hypothetical protein [Clostridia bacterium]
MKSEEKNERIYVTDGDKSIGSICVRYPEFTNEYKKINRFYQKLALSYIHFGQKKIPKFHKGIKKPVNCVFVAKKFYSDNNILSVRCEARIYFGNELQSKNSFSDVWKIPECHIKYLHRYGIRTSMVEYNGKELYFFNK